MTKSSSDESLVAASDESHTKLRHLSNRRRGLIAGLIGVVVLALVFGATRTPLMAVKRVTVLGNIHSEQQELISASGIKLGQPLMDIDLDAISQRLTTKPWVASASATKEWPNTIKISIMERTPLLIAATEDGRWAQLGEHGTVLAVEGAPLTNIPVVVGLKAPSQPGNRVQDPNISGLLTATELLPESLRHQVIQLKYDADGIRLGLSNGVIVLVGNSSDLAAKLTAAASVLSDKSTNIAEISVLDVRSPALPVATPKEIKKTSPSTSTTSTSVKPSTSSSKSKTTTSTTISSSRAQNGKSTTSTTISGHSTNG